MCHPQFHKGPSPPIHLNSEIVNRIISIARSQVPIRRLDSNLVVHPNVIRTAPVPQHFEPRRPERL